MSKITRRNFIIGAGIAGLSVLTSPIANAETTANEDITICSALGHRIIYLSKEDYCFCEDPSDFLIYNFDSIEKITRLIGDWTQIVELKDALTNEHYRLNSIDMWLWYVRDYDSLIYRLSNGTEIEYHGNEVRYGNERNYIERLNETCENFIE